MQLLSEHLCMEKTRVNLKKIMKHWLNRPQTRRGALVGLLAMGSISYGQGQAPASAERPGFTGINYYSGYLAPGFGLDAQIEHDEKAPGDPIPLTMVFYQSQLQKYAISINLYNSGSDYLEGTTSYQNSMDRRNLAIQIQPANELRMKLAISQDKIRDNGLNAPAKPVSPGWDDYAFQESFNFKTEDTHVGLALTYLGKDGIVRPSSAQLSRMRYHPELYPDRKTPFLAAGQLYADVAADYGMIERSDQNSASEWHRQTQDYRDYSLAKLLFSSQRNQKNTELSTRLYYGFTSYLQGLLRIDWEEEEIKIFSQNQDSEYSIEKLFTHLLQHENLGWWDRDSHSLKVRSEFTSFISSVWTQQMWIQYHAVETQSETKSMTFNTSGSYRNDSAKELYRQSDSTESRTDGQINPRGNTMGFATLYTSRPVQSDLSEFLANWHGDFGSRLPAGVFSQYTAFQYAHLKSFTEKDSKQGTLSFNSKSRYGILGRLEMANELLIENNFNYARRQLVDPNITNRIALSWATFVYGEKYGEKFDWQRLSPIEQRYGTQLLPGMAIGELYYVISANSNRWENLHKSDRWFQTSFRLGLPAGINVTLSDGFWYEGTETLWLKDAFLLGVTYSPLPYIRFMINWFDSELSKGLQIRLVSLF